MIKKVIYFSLATGLLSGCGMNGNIDEKAEGNIDTAAVMKGFNSSPVISPAESLKKMQVEEGFAVKLVASEPLVNTPVALTFDNKGRMWVAEMEAYMPDTAGSGENAPTGKIVILEDKNGDGLTDSRTIFLDSLVLPRALCLIENGLLVAEPPNLWYVEIQNDKPGKKTLVDSAYAAGGNPEHQANGLLRGLDNWIYSANSTKRYRKKGNEWLTETTPFRGQWGITKDDYGRLLYNNNSANLLGDYFPPVFGAGNKNQRGVQGVNETIVSDDRVYPIRPTPGVNRAYLKGFLDDKLRLVNVTAACGPVSYRGNLFGEDYHHNVFVAEPSANLIIRNILQEDGYIVTGKQAYSGKEFLASTDERFRPVSLYNGPDGALYIVDMYRGIIQHKTYLTGYLAGQIKERKLTQPLACGRIYKVVPSNKETAFTTIPTDPSQLVQLLGHPNGWVRDKAQQALVDGKHTEMADILRNNLTATDKPLLLTHSLWTMEGLGVLQQRDLLPLLENNNWEIRRQALSVLPSVITRSTYKEYVNVLNRLLKQEDTLAAPLIAFLVRNIQPFDKTAANNLLQTLISKYSANEYVAGAAISNMENREAAYLKTVESLNTDTSLAMHRQLRKVLANVSASKNSELVKKLEKKYPAGVALYKTVCQACHGTDGNGLKALAPPLNGSEWVTGTHERLAGIVLYGLTGPIQVNGKLYKAPEIGGEMPSLVNNKDITDAQLAELFSFIRNCWNNKADSVTEQQVAAVRKKYIGKPQPFTMEELRAIK